MHFLSMEAVHLGDVPFLTGAQLARAIAGKQISSRAALEALLQRAEAFNPRLNAIVVFDVERARKRADEADAALSRGEMWGPFHGVPCTVKENNNVAGLPNTVGFPERKGRIDPENEVMITRLLASGAIIYGKTNLPLDAMDFQSYNAVYGSSSNPWDISRTPGGSSGGSAAAVASGFSPFELGGDVGGSIRIPAAFCGVFGHKPTFKIIPKRGPHLEKWDREISVRGPIARSPEDLRVLMEVVAGADEHITSRGWQLKLPRPTKLSLREFRIAVWADHEYAPVDDELVSAAATVAQRLRKAGAHVDEQARPVDFDPVSNVNVYLTLTAANAALDASKPETVSLRAYRMAQEDRECICDAWERFFDEFDVLICPSYSSLAFVKDETEPKESRKVQITKDGKSIALPYYRGLFWSFLTNVARLPSTTFPCGVGERSGLPLGLNVVSREYNDLICIDFARLLQDECGFGYVAPPGYAKDSIPHSSL